MPSRKLFRLRPNRLDKLTAALARERGLDGAGLATAGSAFTLDELLAPHVHHEQPRPSPHFGAMTTRLWWLTYVLFVAGAVVEHPADGFDAKSVLLVDTYEKPIAWSGVAHLSVWSTGGPPVLVPFPAVSGLLLTRTPEASFEGAARALAELAQAMVDRVNLVVPAARALAASAAASGNG
jgi:hypothetical protein